MFSQCFYIIFNLILIVNSLKFHEINLNTGWQINNGNNSVVIKKEKLPSGIYTALEKNNITQSLLSSYNDINLKWIGNEKWTYSLDFNVPTMNMNYENKIITFHGLDTITTIYLNDKMIGTTDNMFSRDRFNIGELIKYGDEINKLVINFESPISFSKNLSHYYPQTPPECPHPRYNGDCHVNLLRKMQSSFSWDWGLSAPSVGIWKDVILEFYNDGRIRDVTYQLIDDIKNNSWLLLFEIYFENGLTTSEVKGILQIEVPDLPEFNQIIDIYFSTDTLGEFTHEINFTIPKNKVELWWPNGFGAQKLYKIIFTWNSDNIKNLNIGIRTIELIEDPLENGLSFYFKVNNHPIFMKGSNWIPSSILPENSYNEPYIRQLLKAAKYAHMTMIRVWGGGIYETDYFYDLTDQYGLLIWHDLMFACSMYPAKKSFLKNVKREIKQNIRRLQHHASIAIWATNNENEAALQQNWYGTSTNYERFVKDYRMLYVDVVKEEVNLNDKMRICLISSPSNGLNKTEENNWVSQDPQDWHYGDVHYYNYDLNGWNSNIYPHPRFVSEYGFQSLPSLNTWKLTKNDDDDLLQLIDHRQHFPYGSKPIDDLIIKNLPLPDTNSSNYIATYIFYSQLSQAMTVKTETEVYRSLRSNKSLSFTMGALYWQLNDVWVAPSWSSIEYGGQFKLLQYWAQDFLAPISIIPHVDNLNNIVITIVRDDIGEIMNFNAKMEIYKWSDFDIVYHKLWNFSMESNTAIIIDRLLIADYLGNSLTVRNSLFKFTLTTKDDKFISENYVFPATLKNIIGISKNPNIIIKIKKISCKLSISDAIIEINIDKPILFLYLQINNDLIQNYTFSKNGFIQLKRIELIQLKFYNNNCLSILNENDIVILTVNQFM